MWNPIGGFWDWYFRPPLYHFKGCSRTICYTIDRSQISNADAVLFNIPWMKQHAMPEMQMKPPGQLWIASSLENSGYFPHLPEDLSELKAAGSGWRIDLTMTYEHHSDIPTTMFSHMFLNATLEDFFAPPPVPVSDRLPRVGFLYGNCRTRTQRENLIVDLMERFPCDSFGRCWNNQPNTTTNAQPAKWAGALGNDFRRQKFQHMVKLDIVKRYMFTLALENGKGQDWVTEKVYQALLVGVVPIYDGAPNIDELLPCTNCIIKAGDFEDAGQLAAHLHHLVANPAEYQALLAWKQRPFDAAAHPSFVRMMNFSIDSAHCRLGATVAPGSCSGECSSQCLQRQWGQYGAKKPEGTRTWSPSIEALFDRI